MRFQEEVPVLVFCADPLSSRLISMSFLRVVVVVVVVYPQMLSVALLCVCAVAFGRVSARSDSGNFLDDKWLTGRWDKFRDVSCIFFFFWGWLLLTPSPSSLAPAVPTHLHWVGIMRSSFPHVSATRRGALCGFCHTFITCLSRHNNANRVFLF